ncbi:MAG: rhodanese-like domain-containing protein [Verrucomicrobiota bacterium]
MSKQRKRHETAVRASELRSLSDRGKHSADCIFSRQVLLQLLALVGLSSVLGFTFNAASPMGVRFGEPAVALAPVRTLAESNSLPATLLRTNSVVPPAPAPVQVAAAATSPLPVAQPNVPSTPWSVSVASAHPNSVKPAPASPNPTPIHWSEAKKLVAANQAVLMDVRHKPMFDAGHIPGATSVPEMSPPEEFKTFLAKQATNITVIVYCSSTACSQSARVASRLVHEFYWPAVRYMTGGYQEYQQLELANPAPPSRP